LDKLVGQRGQALVMAVGIAVFVSDILALDPAEVAQPLPERLVPRLCPGAGERRQQTDCRGSRLLRPRGACERKSGTRREDQIAPPHSMTSSARARIDCGTAMPSALAAVKLM